MTSSRGPNSGPKSATFSGKKKKRRSVDDSVIRVFFVVK